MQVRLGIITVLHGKFQQQILAMNILPLVTGDYTLSNGRNLISGGPITVNSGVVVTVESGANWTVV